MHIDITVDKGIKIMYNRERKGRGIMKKLTGIKNAYELLKEAGILDRAELVLPVDSAGESENASSINADIDIMDIGEIPFVVDVDTPNGKKTFSLSAENTVKLINWSIDISKKDTYVAIVSEMDEVGEVIKHQSITGIKVEYDIVMERELTKMLSGQEV